MEESRAVPPEVDLDNSLTMINPVSYCDISSVFLSRGGGWCFLLITCVVYVQLECNTSNCGLTCMDCLF